MDTQPTPQNPTSPEQQPAATIAETPTPPAVDAGSQPGVAAPVLPITNLADMPATTVSSDPAAAPVVASTTSSPLEAADQDVIEPEWVDAAESVVSQTAGDPHAEENAVEELQVDYLQKRYGHEVKRSGDK